MEGRVRQREKTGGGKLKAKGADWQREGKGKGSRVTEGRSRQREQTNRGRVQVKGAD